MTTPQDDAKDAALIRILEDCDGNIDKALTEIMRRDKWLIRHAVRRAFEVLAASRYLTPGEAIGAIREADQEAVRKQIISNVLSGKQ